MLSISDTNIEQFFPVFADTNVPVAFLVPTPTGYGKSIMDATVPVRDLLLNAHVHNYSRQGQGPENKEIVTSYFVWEDGIQETSASLYRPKTKHGDPRIWFNNLKRYCVPCNLLALIVINHEIYVINLSNPKIADSLWNREYVYDLLIEANHKENMVAMELLEKIQHIHDLGFLPSITSGDPGVGDTLEHALGINRNNSKAPDYNGIELKTTRLSRNGLIRTPTRSTLFTRVPDKGMTYREIVEHFGKWQIPRNSLVKRLQLYETLRVSRPCAYDLLLEVDTNNDELLIIHHQKQLRRYVSSWYMKNLRHALLTKHRETFWVAAESIYHNGIEYFRYDKILHTKHPNASLLAPLLEADKITVDLAAHFKEDGGWRDHGVLFKMKPQDLPLLLGEPIEYDLNI